MTTNENETPDTAEALKAAATLRMTARACNTEADKLEDGAATGKASEAMRAARRTLPAHLVTPADSTAPTLPKHTIKPAELRAAAAAEVPMLLQGGEGQWLSPVLPLGIPAMLSGPPGAGKTWWALGCAWSVAGGGPMFGADAPDLRLEPAPGGGRDVLILSLEDDRAAVMRRLAAIAGADPSEDVLARIDLLAIDDLPEGATHLFDIATSGAATRASLFTALAERCQERDYALVIIDTFAASCMGEVETSATAATHVIRACGQLGGGKEGKPKPTVLMLHHTRKSDSKGDPKTRLFGALDVEATRGTGAIIGSVRWGGMLAAAHGVPDKSGKERAHIFFRVAKVNGCAMFTTKFHLVHGDGGALRMANDDEKETWRTWKPNPSDDNGQPANATTQQRGSQSRKQGSNGLLE